MLRRGARSPGVPPADRSALPPWPVRQVSPEIRRADQQTPRQSPPPAAATAVAPAHSRPSSTPSSAAVRREDQNLRSASPRVPRRTHCSPHPTHASGRQDRTVATAAPSARRRGVTRRYLENRGTAGSDQLLTTARRNLPPMAAQ